MHNILDTIWHYTIITIDGNHICISNIFSATLVAVIGIKYARLLFAYLRKHLYSNLVHDKDAANAVEKIINLAVIVIYILALLKVANVPLNSFAFIGGAIALGVGLGGQNLMNNLISSVIILIERPIKIGDAVQLEDIIGKVTSIGARATILTNSSNVEIVVPNSKVIQNILVNLTFADHLVRSMAMIKVKKIAYTENQEALLKKMEDILMKIEDIATFPAPVAYFIGVDETYYIYQISFGCDLSSGKSIELIRSKVNLRFTEILNPDNITITHLRLTPSPERKD